MSGDIVRVDHEPVPGRLGVDHSVGKHSEQPRHQGLQRAPGRRRRIVPQIA